MTSPDPVANVEPIGVALVDGDADVRHHRQLMLRSEGFDVRSYGTRAALLADPRSRALACVVVDIATDGDDGAALLRAMRATGWRGRAILLDDQERDGIVARPTGSYGDGMMHHRVGDGALVTAIAAVAHHAASDR